MAATVGLIFLTGFFCLNLIATNPLAPKGVIGCKRTRVVTFFRQLGFREREGHFKKGVLLSSLRVLRIMPYVAVIVCHKPSKDAIIQVGTVTHNDCNEY